MGLIVASTSPRLRKQIVDYLAGEEFDPALGVSSPEEARGRLGLKPDRDADEAWELLVVDATGGDAEMLRLVEAVRSDAATQDLGVLAVTRRVDPRTVQELLGAGCTDFVETPLSETVLRHHARITRRLSGLVSDHQSDSRKIRQLEEQLEEARSEISRLANLDELTDIPVLEQFQKSLQKEWSRLRRSESPLSVAMVDIDEFEDYNRRHGREAGDERLVDVGEILEDQLKRPGDMVARFATAHYVVLLPETDLAGGRIVGENILQAVRALEVEHEPRPNGFMTVSVGVASTIPRQGKDRAQLTMLADDALTQAREEGGNRLVARKLS